MAHDHGGGRNGHHGRGHHRRPWWKAFRTTAAIGYAIRHFHGAPNRMVIGRVKIESGDRVVDLGCGPGEFAVLAAGARPRVRVVAVDPSWPALLTARLRSLNRPAAVCVRRGTAERIPVPDGWANVVVSINAFHHWAEPRAGLAEVRRVLAPGGRVLLVDEDFPEDHRHTRFHHESDTVDPVHAGSRVVRREWLPELGFRGLRLETSEDAEGTPHFLLHARAG